jgi:hypothetical protein
MAVGFSNRQPINSFSRIVSVEWQRKLKPRWTGLFGYT